MDKQQVWIKRLSKSKQTKLMKGGSVRISKGDEQVLNLPAGLAKKILVKFAKEKAHNLNGAGLWDDIKAGAGEAYKIAKPMAQEAYKIAKPMAQQAISTAVDYGTPYAQAAVKGAIASGTAALSAAQPQFAPFLIPAGMALGSMSDSAVSSLGKYAKKVAVGDRADIGSFSPQNVSAYKSHPSVQYARQAAMQDPRVARAMETMQQYHPSQLPEFQQMAPQLALHNYAPIGNSAQAANIAGLQAAANAANVSHRKRKATAKHIVEHAKVHNAVGQLKKKTREQSGKGLYAGAMRGRGGILGGNFVSPFGDHPAMESMPLSVNFASRNFRNIPSASLII
jgi:hypothetical protein